MTLFQTGRATRSAAGATAVFGLVAAGALGAAVSSEAKADEATRRIAVVIPANQTAGTHSFKIQYFAPGVEGGQGLSDCFTDVVFSPDGDWSEPYTTKLVTVTSKALIVDYFSDGNCSSDAALASRTYDPSELTLGKKYLYTTGQWGPQEE